MKSVKLITSAYVGGALRHPHEGVLHIEDDEAKRLVEDKVADDVSDDFSSAQLKELPAETISVDSGSVPSTATVNPHQSEVAPQATTEAHKTSRKAASAKE